MPRPHRHGYSGFALTLAAAILSTTGCNNDAEFQSQWRDREIVVDGDMKEWDGLLDYLEGVKVAIGLTNDDEFLYVGLRSGSNDIERQVLSQGLTLWFSAGDKKEHTFGIRSPLGIRDVGIQPEWLADAGPPAGDRGGDEPGLADLYNKGKLELEVITDGDTPRRMYVADVPGIEVAFDSSPTGLAYELKIPLRTSESLPYAIGSVESSAIRIGFETPTPERPSGGRGSAGPPSRGGGRPGGPGGGGGPGSGPGGGPGGGGPGGRGPGGMEGRLPSGIDVWISATMAEQPGASPTGAASQTF